MNLRADPDIREEICEIVIGHAPPGLDGGKFGIEKADKDLHFRSRFDLVGARHGHDQRMIAPPGMVNRIPVDPRSVTEVDGSPIFP